MFRMRILAVFGVAAVIAACASPSPSSSGSPPPAGAGSPAAPPPASTDPSAVALGVAIDARDDRGAPRLVRAIVPRRAGAAMTPDQAARDHLTALAPLWVGHQRAAQLTSQGQQALRGGGSVVRLQQHVDGVDIHQGELHVMVAADGSLAAISGTLRPATSGAAFQSTAAAAVDRALDALLGPMRDHPAITAAGDHAGYRTLAVAAAPGFEVGSARAKPELLADGDQLRPIWNVELIARSGAARTPAARRYLVGDADGRILGDFNLTASDAYVYRVFADPTGNRNPFDGALASYAPHPTGSPDGSLPGPVHDDLVVMEAFNAPHDPWLGTTATTTSGNNVDAFADIALPEGPGPGDIFPQVRAGRTLNYHYDLTAEPLATPSQSMAAAVNVFFVTNWLHDWYYDSGFTEVAGNAQVDNYGRGGVAGDPLIAHAQAGATLGIRDNANMTTPDDGQSPVMNMFLWSGLLETRLTTASAQLSTDVFDSGPRNFDLTGTLVVADNLDGSGHNACGEVTPSVAGQIALVEMTFDCTPATAVDNVRRAGATGIVAMIAIPGEGAFTLTGLPTDQLPGLVIGYDDGVALEAALPTTVTLHRTTATEHDGDLDNAIISHEWGHYLHHRLASCEGGPCDAISEGWGDFVALHMMLRETDDRDGSFGLGLYALTAGGTAPAGYVDPGYFGIRRFPYSTNRTRNALSLRHIADGSALPDVPTNPGPAGLPNSEPHNAGEVWAEMMWEVYNVLIDQHGYLDARRRISDYVVTGLLLTPPNASYTEQRDAILAAASGLDTDDMLLMAAAFAGRGAGSCAVSPAAGSGDAGAVVESGTVAARLAISAPTLTDDAVSCDHDGHLDPGETGMLRITVANNGAVAAEAVVVRATTTAPGVTLGAPVVLPRIAPLSQVDLAIPVKVALTAPTNAALDLAIAVDGDAGCATRHLTAELHQRMGIDEEPGVAASDGFETAIVAWTPTGDASAALWSRATDGTTNHVVFGADAGFASDTQLVSPVLQASATQPLVVTLQHAYSLEAFSALDRFFDGGVIEVTSDGGAIWRDVTEVGVDPGYPATLLDGTANPLNGRRAFSGTNPAYPAREALTLDFGTQFAGQAVQIRFRLGTDACCNTVGWQLDDIAVTGITNLPFPGVVAEPTRCVAPAAAEPASGVSDVRTQPRARLAGGSEAP